MKHTNTYEKLRVIDEQDRRELLAAVKAHGGIYRWYDEDGEEIEGRNAPIIVGAWKHMDGSEDYIITHVVVNENYVEIYGFPKEGWETTPDFMYWIDHGQIGYIIDEIPETPEVSDVTEAGKQTNDFTIVSVSRDDLKAIGFDGDNLTDDEMQSLAWKMAKGFGGDTYWSSLQYACEAANIPTIKENEDE